MYVFYWRQLNNLIFGCFIFFLFFGWFSSTELQICVLFLLFCLVYYFSLLLFLFCFVLFCSVLFWFDVSLFFLKESQLLKYTVQFNNAKWNKILKRCLLDCLFSIFSFCWQVVDYENNMIRISSLFKFTTKLKVCKASTPSAKFLSL